MADEAINRKLAAILSADVQGYSRLMGADEEDTVRTLSAYREVLTDFIPKRHGRVVDAKGDNVLAEFPSVVDAVRCAVEIQQELGRRNDALAEERRMRFRIGINLGDVIDREGTLYGDGVNIAARMEGLAEGGGICVSGTVFDQIGKKLPVGFEYLGERDVKNIEKPVRAYRVLAEPGSAGRLVGVDGPESGRRRWAVTAVMALIALVAVVFAVRQVYFAPPGIEPASQDKMAFPLPDRPSIAVLPFVNMSGDPEKGYFSDGITEDIITALSKVPKLFVIARNSTFTYKDRPVKVQQVAEELGVRYVLEGSVQKSGEKIRITAQLIDAVKGHHLWAERYDRDLKDIFALQDEIALKVLTALEIKLLGAQASVSLSTGTVNLEAYLKVLQGRSFYERQDRENNFLARRKFEEALALDPDYATASIQLARTHFMDVWLGSSQSPRESLKSAIDLARKAISMDDSLADAHALLGYLYSLTRQHEEAIAQGERALQLDPNLSAGYLFLGAAYQYVGRMQEAVAMIEKAIRLDPIPPSAYYVFLGSALFNAGRYDEAVAAARKAVELSPGNIFAHLTLTTTYSLAGRDDEARSAAAEALRIQPDFSVDGFAKRLPYKDPADVARIVEALRRAGLK